MDPSTCRFETARLQVQPWASVPLEAKRALVGNVLTPAATRELPPHWHGPIADVDRWIDERADEAPALVSHEGQLIGFLTLYPDGEELRVGYVLGESWWGRGLATELVEGLVDWARAAGARRLLAGVTRENPASGRVLTKNGFTELGGDEVLDYERRLTR